MANLDNKYGFEPVRNIQGGCIKFVEQTIASGYATSIFKGDPVIVGTSGSLEIAKTNKPVYGIFAGVQYKDSDGVFRHSSWWKANTVATEITAFVYADPFYIYSVQADAGGTALAADDVQKNATFLAGTGDTRYGVSRYQLDSSSADSTATLPFRIIGLLRDGNYEENEWGDNVKVEVMLNGPQLTATTGSQGA